MPSIAALGRSFFGCIMQGSQCSVGGSSFAESYYFSISPSSLSCEYATHASDKMPVRKPSRSPAMTLAPPSPGSPGSPKSPVDLNRERWLDIVRPMTPEIWAVPPEKKETSDEMFTMYQKYNQRRLSLDVFIEVFPYNGLDKSDLEQVWHLADYDKKGFLDIDDFAVAMYLLYLKVDFDQSFPRKLPAKLIPPPKRETKVLWLPRRPKRSQRQNSTYSQDSSSSTDDVFMRNCTPQPPYAGFTKELWEEIFNYVYKSDLTTTAQVSKLFHALSISRIYHTINFCIPNYPIAIFDYTEKSLPLPEPVQSALVQQYRFKKALLRNPQFGKHIKYFTWTLGIKGYAGLPDWIDDEKVAKGTYEFYTREAYKIFSLLRNAIWVHIDAPGHFESLIRLNPLFPFAQHLHLGGAFQMNPQAYTGFHPPEGKATVIF